MKEHKYVNLDYVRNNPTEKWNLYYLSKNKQLTVKDIDTLILPNSIGSYNWYIISKYINIREVRNNPNRPWNKRKLSCNKTLTVKDVETLILPNSLDKWDWYVISGFININEVINNPNKPWYKRGLLHSGNCTEKITEFFDAGLLRHLQKNIYTFKYHTDISIKCEF